MNAETAWLNSLEAQKEKWMCAMGCELPAAGFSTVKVSHRTSETCLIPTIPLLGSFQGLDIEVSQPALCRCADTEYFSYSSPSCFSCSSNKRERKTNQVKCCNIYMPTNLIVKIDLYVNYNVLITNTFVQLPIFFLFLCM